MEVDTEIDRLYGLPLDEFVRERDDLAKRLNRAGDREAGARVKALRKPTVGAWALNQAVRRRRAETDALLATGTRLRAAHADLLTGGDPAVLREAMDEERSLTTSLADCAEAIASETGKSGPALRDRVRATLHAATVEDEARDELAAGRFVREREAIGLGALAGDSDAPSTARPERRSGSGRRSSTSKSARPARERRSTPAGERRATRERPAREKRAAAPAPAEPAPDTQLEESERLLDEARVALSAAEADHAAAISRAESAREALEEAEQAEREARRVVRELWREVAKQERRVERRRI